MSRLTIESVANGYIIVETTDTHIYSNLQGVFESLLLRFEGKCKHFGGSSFAEVIINYDKQED